MNHLEGAGEILAHGRKIKERKIKQPQEKKQLSTARQRDEAIKKEHDLANSFLNKTKEFLIDAGLSEEEVKKIVHKPLNLLSTKTVIPIIEKIFLDLKILDYDFEDVFNAVATDNENRKCNSIIEMTKENLDKDSDQKDIEFILSKIQTSRLNTIEKEKVIKEIIKQTKTTKAVIKKIQKEMISREKQEKKQEEIKQQKERREEETTQPIKNIQEISSTLKPLQKTRLKVLKILTSGDTDSVKSDRISEAMVDYIEADERIYTMRDDSVKELWIYQDGIYKPNGISFVEDKCRYIMGESLKKFRLENVILKIRTDTKIDKEEFFEIKEPFKVALKNGIFDLKNKKLESFDPDQFFFNKINVTYNPKAECPKIIKFIKDIVHDEEDVKIVQEIAGLCLAREYFIEKGILFDGTGRNGKSKLLELFRRFIGIDSCAAVSLYKLDADQFAASELHNKLVNIGGDIGTEVLRHTQNFKGLTGRDSIGCARKYKTQINFTNHATMLFACNQIPESKDNSVAFFERWCIIRFPHQFIKKEDYDLLTDKKNNKIMDTEIIEKITSSEELNGFFNFALEGLHRLFKQSDFSESKNSIDVRTHWKRKSEPFKTFCEEYITANEAGFVSKIYVEEKFKSYCRKYQITKKVMKKRQKEILVEIYSVLETKKNNLNSWDGIDFNDELFYSNFPKTEPISQSAYIGVEVEVVGSRGKIGKPTIDGEQSNLNDGIIPTAEVENIWDIDDILKKSEELGDDNFVKLVEQYGKERIDKMITEGVLMETKPGTLKKV